MNGTGSKYSNHVREWRWTVGVVECICVVLKTFQSWHGTVLCRRRRTDLASERLRRWIELNAEWRIRWRGRGWIRRSEPDIHTRNPTFFSLWSIFHLLNWPIHRFGKWKRGLWVTQQNIFSPLWQHKLIDYWSPHSGTQLWASRKTNLEENAFSTETFRLQSRKNKRCNLVWLCFIMVCQ